MNSIRIYHKHNIILPKSNLLFFMLTISLLLIGCKKLIEIPDPDTEVVRKKVFKDDGTALAALSGIYQKLVNSPVFSGGFASPNITMGVYADELIAYQGYSSLIPYYNNQLAATDPSISSAWGTSYEIIYAANSVIEGANASSSLSTAVKQQMTGEALFVRAFVHFYLSAFFGAVPYISNTDYLINTKKARQPLEEVYQALAADLKEAISLLENQYPVAERVRVNKGAAIALLARVYLYQKEWALAETQATLLISNTSQYELTDSLNRVFLRQSKEAIWQLIPAIGITNEGQAFILLTQPTRIALRNGWVDAAFEQGDVRKQQWIGTVSQGFSRWNFPYKYKRANMAGTSIEHSVMLRLAEQYLIRAEARAMQNKLTGAGSAASDIDRIRQRAGLPATKVTTQTQLLAAIEQERRVELFSEWGHRFFDLKRWGRVDEVLGPIKPGWQSTDALLPLPQRELLANKNLTQNQGY